VVESLRAVRDRRALPAALIAVVPLLFAACAQLDDNQVGFWDILWSLVVFFFWFMFIWIFIQIFADIFRRDDLSGGWKAIWLIALIFLPFLGALIYIISRPKATAQDVKMMAQAEAAMKAASGVSTADELTKLAQLRDAGVISVPEYEKLKEKLLAGS
jgi:uncharacterized membrane protein